MGFILTAFNNLYSANFYNIIVSKLHKIFLGFGNVSPDSPNTDETSLSITTHYRYTCYVTTQQNKQKPHIKKTYT